MTNSKKTAISTTIPEEYEKKIRYAMATSKITMSDIITNALEKTYGFKREQRDIMKIISNKEN